MKKKFLSILAAFVVLVSFSACQAGDTGQTPPLSEAVVSETTTASETETTSETAVTEIYEKNEQSDINASENILDLDTEVNEIDMYAESDSKFVGIKCSEFSDEYFSIEIQSDKITLSDFSYSENLKRLTISKLGSDNLDGIENFPNLEYLALDDVCIKDISAISKLENLDTIWIHFTDTVEDYSVLSELKNLKEFTAILCEDGSSMPNIEAIAECSKLEKLFLQGFTIDNIEFVGNLKNLKSLRLWSYKTPITDISPLPKLDKLEELEITYSSNDMSSFVDMVSLQKLSIERDVQYEDKTYMKKLLSDMLPNCKIDINY